MALVPQQRGRRGVAALALLPAGDLRRNHLAWTAPSDAARFVVHARPLAIGTESLLLPAGSRVLAEVDEPAYDHLGLSPHGEAWEYVVQAVDDGGAVCAQSDPTKVTSLTSVTVGGRSVASVGSFDGAGDELALARAGYVRYQSTFPADVDFRYGVDDGATQWSWVQPGPDDAWAGRRSHRFRMRFELDERPARDLDLAVWLIDRHPTRAGAAGVLLNGRRCGTLVFAERPDSNGDHLSEVPGHGAGPAYLERPLAADHFRSGENVVEIVKDQGSWIAYDALGIFSRT